jgi:hypothetical protein
MWKIFKPDRIVTTTQEPNFENTRTEYSALSNYFQTVVSFRFTVIGFYMAFLGLIISIYKDIGQSINHYFLFGVVVFITFIVWIIDIRSRVLYGSIGHRGKEIETLWGLSEGKNSHPYYLHMMRIDKEKTRSITSEEDGISSDNPDKYNLFHLHFHSPRYATYSIAIDLLLSGVVATSVILMILEATQTKSYSIFAGFVYGLGVVALIWSSMYHPEK